MVFKLIHKSHATDNTRKVCIKMGFLEFLEQAIRLHKSHASERTFRYDVSYCHLEPGDFTVGAQVHFCLCESNM